MLAVLKVSICANPTVVFDVLAAEGIPEETIPGKGSLPNLPAIDHTDGRAPKRRADQESDQQNKGEGSHACWPQGLNPLWCDFGVREAGGPFQAVQESGAGATRSMGHPGVQTDDEGQDDNFNQTTDGAQPGTDGRRYRGGVVLAAAQDDADGSRNDHSHNWAKKGHYQDGSEDSGKETGPYCRTPIAARGTHFLTLSPGFVR
jgi:hypothetical protein